METRTRTPALAALARQIDAAVRRGAAPRTTAREVAGALGAVLGDPGLLTGADLRADADRYRQHVLHVDPAGAFSIVSLVWLPGQFTAIHDHVAWCVIGVHTGVEEETLYRLADDGSHLTPAGHAHNAQGSTSFFVPPGDIHEVRNSSAGMVVSVHVYGADVSVRGTSVRRRYDLPIRG